MAHADDADRARLTELYAVPDGRGPAPVGEPMGDAEVAEVLAILERSGAREHTLGEARRYRDLALRHLELLPCPLDRKRDLAELVRSVIAA
jgi:geranylgeranyl pyrophosphate synthase